MRKFAKVSICCLAVLLAGCTAKHYRKSADKEVYKIIQQKQKAALGATNDFSINTPYSSRKPEDIKSQEIVSDRMREGAVRLTLPDALRMAIENNRSFQTERERLYLTALNLTGERFRYVPQFFAGSQVTGERDANADTSLAVESGAGMDVLFKTGGRLGIDLANDLFSFYTGSRSDSALSTIRLTLSQPILRGAGAKIAAEGLKQAERDVIYAVRTFSYYQDTFAFGIVQTYFRLVQQQDTVKNQYNNFISRVSLRERAVALSFDRLAPFQADLARQEELAARNSYILAVERYRASLDDFKLTLGLPVGFELRLDENSLAELEGIGLLPVPLADEQAIKIAIERRPDLLNRIDIFEDRKRKIDVAADQLKPDLLLFGNAGLDSQRPRDYTRFDIDEYSVNGGVRLDLPLNRKSERNDYRATIINFEVELRTLANFLDTLKNDVRGDLRTLEQSRQSYEIQNSAKALADRRVEANELSLQAGRIQVRDVVDAQTARVQAYNAATAALVDYHLTRLRLLLDLGALNTARDKFWLAAGDLPKTGDTTKAPPAGAPDQLITPEQLFKNEQRN